MFIWISLCSLGPFLLIIFLWNGGIYYNKYFSGAQKVRELNLNIFGKVMRLENLLLFFHSLIFRIISIPFIETINSIGFINKCLLGLTTIYLFHKKLINKFAFYFINIWPSIFIYSSLSLKDNLSLILSILFLYFLFKRDYFLSLILLILIFPIKIINSLLFVLIFLTYFIFWKKYI